MVLFPRPDQEVLSTEPNQVVLVAEPFENHIYFILWSVQTLEGSVAGHSLKLNVNYQGVVFDKL